MGMATLELRGDILSLIMFTKETIAVNLIAQMSPPWVTRWANLRGMVRDMDAYATRYNLPLYSANPERWQLVDWWPFPAACNARVFKNEGDNQPWCLPFRVTGNGQVVSVEPEIYQG